MARTLFPLSKGRRFRSTGAPWSRRTPPTGSSCAILVPLVEREYYARFPTRARRPEPWRKEIQKKAQEIARYALPVATFAYLYHTVSGLTLLRYYRTMGQFDTPMEQRMVIEMMVQRLLEHDPSWKAIMEEPIPPEETVEFGVMASHPPDDATAREFVAEFDAGLEGRTSKLVDWSAGNETILAQSVREIFGLTRGRMPDDEAIALALDPARNAYLGETLNTTTHSKLSRALFHPRFVFRKKLSHTADSQNQRHRMTPGSRPILAAHFTGEPDVVTPPIVEEDPAVHAVYRRAMEGAWEGIARLRAMGVGDEYALYLLPNADGDPLHRVDRPAESAPQARDASLLQRAGGDLARQSRRGGCRSAG